MSNWEANVRRVEPYVPGEQPKLANLIKLNTNENPYPPAPGVLAAIRDFDPDTLRLYPDPAASALVSAIAANYGLTEEQVFVGVGSDDVLSLCFMTYFNSDKPVLFPDITYSFYDVWANLHGVPFATPALDENFCLKKEDYMVENGGIIFPNPNAPTGVLMPLSEIEEIVAANPDSVVIVDEAYIDFGGASAVALIDRYENLLVVQTYSKSRSMAGIRIGYAMGNAKLISYLNDVKYSFNSYTMNRITIDAGVAAIADVAYFEETTAKIIATRERTKKELSALGFTFGDSMSNFLFVTHKTVPAEQLFADLRKESIIVRYFKKPRIDNYLRITIGTDAEMDALITFLKGYLK